VGDNGRLDEARILARIMQAAGRLKVACAASAASRGRSAKPENDRAARLEATVTPFL